MTNNLESITVTVIVDRKKLNEALGNTPNVTAKQALAEALDCLKDEGLGGSCGCGCSCYEPDPLPIYVTFME